jgi:aminoglycoside 3-N-acetyltransferase I
MNIPAWSIKRLGSTDIAAARDLNRLFGRAFEDADTYEGQAPSDAWLARLLARETAIALVATIADAVVGGLVAYQLEKLEQARSEVYLYDLAVDLAFRRRGIATALIKHLQGLAAECGVWVVFVQADYSDPPAIALYEKLGRREEVLHFDIVPFR